MRLPCAVRRNHCARLRGCQRPLPSPSAGPERSSGRALTVSRIGARGKGAVNGAAGFARTLRRGRRRGSALGARGRATRMCMQLPQRTAPIRYQGRCVSTIKADSDGEQATGCSCSSCIAHLAHCTPSDATAAGGEATAVPFRAVARAQAPSWQGARRAFGRWGSQLRPGRRAELESRGFCWGRTGVGGYRGLRGAPRLDGGAHGRGRGRGRGSWRAGAENE